MCLKELVTFIAVFISVSDGARILAIVPTTSYSHQVFFHPLWRELSLRGHQITLLTTDPINDPTLTNLTEINLHFSYKIWNNYLPDIIYPEKYSIIKSIDNMVSSSNAIIDSQLSHPEVKALIQNKTEHFDLIMIEFLMPTMLAFVERFKCPFIGITSLEAPDYAYESSGNPNHPITNPEPSLPFEEKLTLLERLVSVLFVVFTKLYGELYVMPNEQQTVKKHFGENYPPLLEIAKRISMLFVNTDPIFHRVRAVSPNVIQIGGGTHRHIAQPLPKDLKKILDAATQGFIFFSLGTNVKGKDIPEHTRKVILEAFSELPYIILWKFELEDMPDKSKNIILSKWFPQQDIFKHPNIKLFITQGGLQSIDEAIYDHVPILGMPFFADQPKNIRRIESRGIGLSVDYKTITKDAFKKAILEVIKNPKYRSKVKELAQLAQDQPTTGLERAVWWTEYVLRHKGAKHLRGPLSDIPWYQYILLDVVCVILAILIIINYLLYRTVKLCIKIITFLHKKIKIKTE